MLGYVEYHLSGDPDGINPLPGAAYISLLWVTDKGKGHGSCYLALAEYALREQGAEWVTLDPSPLDDTPLHVLVSWYERHGYSRLSNGAMAKQL